MVNLEIIRALLGLLAFGGLIWLLAERPRKVRPGPLLIALAWQVGLFVALTRIPVITTGLQGIADAVHAIQTSAVEGAAFVFGYLATEPSPDVAGGRGGQDGFIFAFQALPALLLVSALSSLLWHWGILQRCIRVMGVVSSRLFGVSGAVGISTSACIFLGMVEAPTLLRPLIPRLTRAELFVIMVHGMAVIAGSMMILLASLLDPGLPLAFSHLLIASLINTPMAIAIARSILPLPDAGQEIPTLARSRHGSSLGAIVAGTLNAISMVVGIAALLLVFIALVALADRALELLPHAGTPWSVAGLLGYLFTPIAWLMGVPSADVHQAASLLGSKVALNEVVAYRQLAGLEPDAIALKTRLMLIYALCSFANIGSVGILIGALGAMAPARRREIAAMGWRALAAAFLASCISATTVGILLSLV